MAALLSTQPAARKGRLAGDDALAANDAVDRRYAAAVGEDRAVQRRRRETEMSGQRALEDRPDIGGRRQVAPFEEGGITEARPVRDDAPALDRAAQHEGDRAGPVIG